MIKIALALLILMTFIGHSQDQISQANFIQEGKVKTTYYNNNFHGYSKPEYEKHKKVSEVLEVTRVNGEVHSFKLTSDQMIAEYGGQLFEIYGHKMSDGSYEDILGYYNSSGDVFALCYNNSIYIIKRLNDIYHYSTLEIYCVLGDAEPASREELVAYLKPTCLAYSKNHKAYLAMKKKKAIADFEQEKKEKEEKKKLEEEEKLNQYSIERNEIASIKLISEFSEYVNDGERAVIIGVESVFKNGIISKTQEFKGGGINAEYFFEVEGAFPSSQHHDASLGGWFHYNTSHKELPTKDDCIKVKVKRRSNDELLLEDKINLEYNIPLYYNFKGANGIRGYKGNDGAQIEVDIELIEHSETWEDLLLYTIRYDYGIYDRDGNRKKGTYYVKMNPKTELKITYHGGKGGNGNTGGYAGGKQGSLKLNVASNVKEYNLVHFGIDGDGGFADYQGEVDHGDYGSTTDYSSSTSDEFTIINNTGSAINLIDEGGNGEGSLNDGSSKTFDCDEVIYQAKLSSSGSWNIKGRLIANGKNACGQTITFE